jgi:hypothetical protein
MIRKRANTIFHKSMDLSKKTGVSIGICVLDEEEEECGILIASRNPSWSPSFESLSVGISTE